MPRIKPFQALRPVADLASRVASVPYDVVNRDEAAALADGNPLSFLHVVRPDIDFPPEQDPYAPEVYDRAAYNLQQLLVDGVLIREPLECLYAYRQVMNGRAQTGIVCCVHIDDYENNLILKHEKTRKSKEDDRTRHVLALKANAGPVFLTYRTVEAISQQAELATSGKPLYDFTAVDGIRHTVWRIPHHESLVEALSTVPVFYIADGHHRAASAWRAGAELRKRLPEDQQGIAECNWFLAVLFPSTQLQILAYNRALKDLNGHSPEEVLTALGRVFEVSENAAPVPVSKHDLAFYLAGQWRGLRFKPEFTTGRSAIDLLDVSLLQNEVLAPLFGIDDPRTSKRVAFVGGIRGTAELEKLVDSGEFACAFSMFPTGIEDLMEIADAGGIMPPKSTWFEPKLRDAMFSHLI